MAADLLEWSQRSRERLKEFVAREIASQMNSMGVATQADLDAVKKRVRDLERRAGMTASGRRSTAKKSTAKKTAAEEARPPKSTAKPTTAAILGIGSVPRRRLDVELVRRGLASSRAEAQAAVAAGRVTVAGSPATKAASLVADDAPVQVLGPARRFVSRGGEKLRSALDRFGVDPARPRLPRRRRLHGRVHRLPAAGGRGARRGRRRRLRPARVGDPQRPARHGDGAHERAEPGARAPAVRARPGRRRPVVHLAARGAARARARRGSRTPSSSCW